MGNFNNLVVWQRSKDLAVRIFRYSQKDGIKWNFGYKDQLLRASLSIPSNIAEGEQLDTDRQSVKHFYIARGSAAELHTLLIIGLEVGYFSGELVKEMEQDIRYISVGLTNLIRSRCD
ncbi:MAG: four helix bundle protein [Bacteroidetes bacterium]|nr:four helix bundle protein [Bacteroidota bacterium]